MQRDSRKIAAILAADVVGYSRLMGLDEAGTLAALRARREIFDRLVTEYDGREFGSVGDSLMAQFPSAINAVLCAQAIQRGIAAENAHMLADRRMFLRIGINLGDVIEEHGSLFGDSVNVAARLQSLAEPGGVLVSAAVYEQVRNKLNAAFRFVGVRQVKNIAEPVRTYEVCEPVAATLTHRILTQLRRRVLLAGAIYLVAATSAVWLTGRLIGEGRAPDWALPALISLLAAGFVPAMAIAWHFDRRRTAPWIGFTASAVVIGAACLVAWTAWQDYFDARARQAITRPAVKAQPVVAVAALRNLTGDRELDWLQEGIANLVRDGLAESRHLVVVSPRRWQAVLRAGGGDAGPDEHSAAARAGIDYVVSGEFLKAPEGLLLTTRLSDVDTGVEMQAQRIPGLTRETLLGAATHLVLLAKRGLGVPHTESVASFSADFAVQNMAAYEAYLGGLGYFLKFDYRAAEQAFRSALELAPDYHMARYRLAHVQVAGGDTEGALASLAQIPADARLTPRERQYVEGARALFARDVNGAKAVYVGMLEQYPFDVEARWLLALAHDAGLEDEAAVAELERLIEQEPENEHLWSYLGETWLRLGDPARAREALDRYLALKPSDPFGLTILGQLEQQTGRLEEAAARFAEALQIETGFAPAHLALARTEMLRGRWDEAERLFSTLTADHEASATFRIDAAFDLSALRRAEGRFGESLAPLQDLEPEIRRESIREAMALAQRGVLNAELGRFGEASRLVDLAVERSPGASTRYLFARGLVRLMQGDLERARDAAREIRSLQASPGDPGYAGRAQENAVRAALQLEGMIELRAGQAANAAAILRRAESLPGYEYALYKLGLARAVLADGDAREALRLARDATEERQAGQLRLDDLRLDLEVDRTRAVLLEAEILAQMGELERAQERARAFLRRWRASDPDQPERLRAERLTKLAAVARGA